jgi:hypothetical protein
MKQVRHGNGDEKTRCAHVALRVALRERHAPLAHRRLPAFPGGERAPVAFTWVWVGPLGSFTHGAPLFLKPRPSPRPKNLWICEIPSALFRSPTDTLNHFCWIQVGVSRPTSLLHSRAPHGGFKSEAAVKKLPSQRYVYSSM